MPVSECFHVRVLIPCYTEALEIVQPTLMAVANAALPKAPPARAPGCCKHENKSKAVPSNQHWRWALSKPRCSGRRRRRP